MTMSLYRKQVFDDFTSVDGWVGAGNCATSGYGPQRNTTSSFIKTGKASMKVAFDYDANTSGTISKTYTSTYAFSKYDEVWINVYIDDVNDLDATGDQAFRFYVGNDNSNYLRFYKDDSELKSGWNTLKWVLTNLDDYVGITDLDSVDYLSIQSYDGGVSDYTFYFDSIWLMKKIVLHNTMSPVSRRMRGRATGYTIPRRTTPLVQTTGVEPSEWSLDFTLLNSYGNSVVSYGSEYDRVLSSSQLEDCLLKPCVLEPGLESSTIEFRDDDGVADSGGGIDDANDRLKKYVYVPTVTNLKTATVYVYLREDPSNPVQDADTVDVSVNSVWYVGVWSGADTSTSYQWLTLELPPELLVEGFNEIIFRGVGVSGSDVFQVGIDTNVGYQRSQYSTDGGSTYSATAGEYMVYLSCTYEHLSQYSTTPRHIIPTGIDFNYQAGRVHTLPYRMSFVEDTM